MNAGALLGVGLLVALVLGTAQMDNHADKRSTTEQLFMISSASESAFKATKLAKPWPEVRTRYEPGNEIASANLLEDGTRVLYVNRAFYSIGGEAMRGTVCHEAVHFAIGERYGKRHLAGHGPMFKQLCRETCGAAHCTEAIH